MQIKRDLYYYFHGTSPGKSTVFYLNNEKRFIFSLSGDETRFLDLDPHQLGILTAFDGTLLWGSLPKRKKTLLYHRKIFDLEVPVENLRNSVEEEEKPQYQIIKRGEKSFATLPVYRSVMILPFNFRTVVRRYDERSLNPKYLIITTDEKSVKWENTSW